MLLYERDNDIEFAVLEGTYGIDDVLEGLNTYFVTKLLNLPWEIELIQAWENNPNVVEHDMNGGFP